MCYSRTNLSNELLLKRQLALVLGPLERIPGGVDVGQELAVTRSVWTLVVSAHTALQCEEQYFQLALFDESEQMGLLWKCLGKTQYSLRRLLLRAIVVKLSQLLLHTRERVLQRNAW